MQTGFEGQPAVGLGWGVRAEVVGGEEKCAERIYIRGGGGVRGMNQTRLLVGCIPYCSSRLKAKVEGKTLGLFLFYIPAMQLFYFLPLAIAVKFHIKKPQSISLAFSLHCPLFLPCCKGINMRSLS